MKHYVPLFGILLIAAILISGCTQQTTQTTSTTPTTPVKCSDPPCLSQYFPSCTPAEMTMSSEGQSIKVTIHGFVNETCHYTMIFGNVTAADCYFKRENLNNQVLNQMFGNDEGQDAVIAEACRQ